MKSSVLSTVCELQAFVRENSKIHVIGKGSKSSLHRTIDACSVADLSGLQGISEYQPQEYTLTVHAGTAVSEIQAELGREGQYLPFDPLMPDQATIGGTVACNLSGSRRFRYGGVRDFILGAQVVDGLGRSFRVGGKVVKNSAGFDLAKFLVGSMGQYAIMTELTFKVFPEVPHFRGLRLHYASLEDTLRAVYSLNQSVFELEALDFAPEQDGWSLLACLAGFAETLPRRVDRFLASMKDSTALLGVDQLDAVAEVTDPLSNLTQKNVVKVVLPPRQIPRLDGSFGDMQRRYSAGGNLAWVATDDISQLDELLLTQGLRGLCILGDATQPLIGKPVENVLAARVKRVLDPQNKLI